MALDPNIIMQGKPVQIENPLTQMAQITQIQGAQNQNRLADMLYSEKQRGMEEDNAVRQAYASSTDGKSRLDALAKVSPKGYQAEAKFQSEQQKSQRDTEKSQIEIHLKKFEAAGQIMAPVKDQASWMIAKQETARVFGPEVAAQMPDVYDPALIEQKRLQAMTVKDQLEQLWKQKGYDLDVDKFGYQQKNDAQNRSVAIRGQDVSASTAIRGQNMTDARGKESNDIKRKELGIGGTEGERNAAGYGLRMFEADKIIDQVTKMSPGDQKPGMIERVAGRGLVTNLASSDDRQRYRQAQEDWVRAKLRKESGAVIGEEEMEREIQTYFPQAGEGKPVIEQKEKARRVALEAMKTAAGKAGKGIEASGGGSAASPSAPKPGTVMDGYRFKGGNPADQSAWEKM